MSTSSEHPADRPAAEGPERRPAAPRTGGAGERKRRRRRRRRNPILVTLGWIFKILGSLLLIAVVTGCFVACYGVIYIQTVIMPEAAQLDLSAYVLNEPSTIYYTDKDTGRTVELALCVGTENRQVLEPNEIPQVFRAVAIAAEDKRFLNHKGVDWIRTGAAVLYMFTGKDIQGGSTITQQVIKNYTQNDEVTVKRKVLEIFEALAVEDRYSKDDILGMYLNYIFLGDRQYGIAAAARYYFNKDVNDITLAEAASIIAITNNPSLYGPYSTVETRNPKTGAVKTGLERNKDRQEAILYVMCYDKDIAMISEAEYQAAIAEPLNFAKGVTGEDGPSDINSWYVDEVIAETVSHFMSQGYSRKAAENLVYYGGLHIYTPFDPSVQEKVDEVYTDLDNITDSRTGRPYTSKDGQQLQSCITIVDNSTGYVVAMAGQLGTKTGNRWWNFATDSVRQPGSSIKPLAAYSTAIEMGFITPYSVIDDSPYMLLDDNPYPRNDNRRYRGLTTAIQGITSSTNTIAVKLVGNYVTPDGAVQFLREKYGITSLVDHLESNGKVFDDHGLPQMALGGLTKGLSPYEMTAAYATFPRGGAYTEPTVVLRVEDREHNVVWDHTPKTTYPIKESTAHYMNVMLQNAATYGTGGGSKFSDMPVAGKTGTTTDNYDRWFAGFTPYYTGVVWTGYERNAYMSTNGNPAIPLWKKVMAGIHEGLETKPLFSVSNLKSCTICLDCGELATDACHNDIRGDRTATHSFVDGTQPKSYCTCHVPITICVDSPIFEEDGTFVDPAWNLAGEYCPEVSIRTVYVVNLRRDAELCARVTVEDEKFLITYYEGLAEMGAAGCTVHTQAPEPDPPVEPIDPVDPNNPGGQDPNAPVDPNDPGDPGGEEGGSLLPPSATQNPPDPAQTQTDPPQTQPDPAQTQPDPSQSPEQPPSDPYVPAADPSPAP